MQFDRAIVFGEPPNVFPKSEKIEEIYFFSFSSLGMLRYGKLKKLQKV